MLFANPANLTHRFDLTMRMSYDEGRTWPVQKRIKQSPGAYSSIAVFPDGTIGFLFETGNKYNGVVEYYATLALARFNLEWLTDGSDLGPPASSHAEAQGK